MSDVIWDVKLDGVYRCYVERVNTHNGVLRITDEAGKELFKKDVGLSFGAVFGPDVSDVAYWQSLCEEAIPAD